MVKTNLVMPNSLLDVDINSHVEVKNPLRYPKRYLGSKEEKQKQIAEDLANDDISTDEEFTKLENDVRKRRLDEFLGNDSGSDKEFLISKYPSLINPSESETEDRMCNNKRKKKYQKKISSKSDLEDKNSSTLKNQAPQNSLPIVTENTSSQVIFDESKKIPDMCDENPDHVKVSAKRMLNFSNEDSGNLPGIIMFTMISEDLFSERMISLENGKKLLIHMEDKTAFIKHEIKYDNLVFHSEGVTSGPHAVLSFEKGQFYLNDLNSNTGTYLDKNKMKPNSRCLLHSGQYVNFGNDVTAKIKILSPHNSEQITIEKSPLPLLSNKMKSKDTRSKEDEIPLTDSGFIIFHPATEDSKFDFVKRQICLKSSQSMEIFRFDPMDHFRKLANENNLVFFCPKLSRKHATLYFDNENFYISDHSTNGTSITNAEGTKVLLEKKQKYIIHSGDVVSFGDHICDAINARIEIKDQKRKTVSEKFEVAKKIRMESSNPINNNSLENNNSIEDQTSTDTKSGNEEKIINTEEPSTVRAPL